MCSHFCVFSKFVKHWSYFFLISVGMFCTVSSSAFLLLQFHQHLELSLLSFAISMGCEIALMLYVQFCFFYIFLIHNGVEYLQLLGFLAFTSVFAYFSTPGLVVQFFLQMYGCSMQVFFFFFLMLILCWLHILHLTFSQSVATFFTLIMVSFLVLKYFV